MSITFWEWSVKNKYPFQVNKENKLIKYYIFYIHQFTWASNQRVSKQNGQNKGQMCSDLDRNQIAGMAMATVAMLDLTSICLKIGKFSDWSETV